MAVTLALQTASATGQPVFEKLHKTLRLYFTATFSGSYTTGGDACDLTKLFATAAGTPGLTLPTGSMPLKVVLESAHPAASPQTALFQYNFAPGTNLTNGTIQVFTGAAAQSGGAELSAGAYPAGVTGDTVIGEAVFPSL